MKEYEVIAGLMNDVQRRDSAELRYHILADGIYWSDEIPEGLTGDAEDCIRILLRYRTSMITGRPEKRFEVFWTSAKRAFPDWIGFDENRVHPSEEVVAFYEKKKADITRKVSRISN